MTSTATSAMPTPLLHASPAVGFEQPFEMLEACHERVKRSLDLLQRLGAHLDAYGADTQAAAAARDVLRYFDIAGPLHHEDEERHVLPRLRASGHGALAERLHTDHTALSAAWQGWRTVLEGVCAGRWDGAAATRVRAGWREFEALYEAHIAIEEAQAFPCAAHGLPAGTLAAMGHEMAGRRRPTPEAATGPGTPA